MKPEIQKVLRASGLDKTQQNDNDDVDSIGSKLNRAGLSTDRIAEELCTMATSSGNETLRLRALETAMKAHGVLKENPQVAIPTFNLIIQQQDLGNPAHDNANQILFPRQSLKTETERTN